MNKNTVEYCPNCDDEIMPSDINIKEGVALCSGCGELSRLSDLNFSGSTTDEILSKPFKDIIINSDSNKIEVSISLFSITKFLGSLAISIFWNGIVSIFLSLAVAAVYFNLFGPVPDWFPVLGLKEGKPIMNDEVMGVGATIFLCAFLIPFVIIGTGMIINTLLRLFGTTQIVIDKNYSYVSTGISLLRLKKQFDPTNVKSVKYVLSKFNQENQSNYVIEISSTKCVKFGLLLSEKQQNWASSFLRAVLIQKRDLKNIEKLYWL
ncbi:MAG: hypothetical protein QM501_03115 [Gimesia sp.]